MSNVEALRSFFRFPRSCRISQGGTFAFIKFVHKQSFKNYYFKRLFFSLGLASTIGCIKGTIPFEKGNFGSTTDGSKLGRTCPAKVAAQLLSVTETHSQNRAFHTEKMSINTDPGGITAAAAATEFASGKELAVLADQSCLRASSQIDQASHLFRRLSRDKKLFLSEKSSRNKTFTVTLDKTFTRAELSYEAETDSCIMGVSGSEPMTITTVPFASAQQSGDPLLNSQKQHGALNSDSGWKIFFDSKTGIKQDIVIAVIDTGVDIQHEDLKTNLWTNPKEIPNNGIDDDQNGFVDDVHGYNFVENKGDPSPTGSFPGWDHGTHVAGLAAASLDNGTGGAGVMGEHVKIMALNVFGKAANVFPEALDAAIRYAADNGAHVINLSLGSLAKNDTDLAAIEYAIGKGVVILAAAGNSGGNSLFYPASFSQNLDGLLSVASIDAMTLEISSFSNYGPNFVQIAAPGSNGILSTLPQNNYGLKEGTSMASPITAGAAGLVYGMIWTRTGQKPKSGEIKNVLMSAAIKSSKLTGLITDGNQLDIGALAKYVDSHYPFKSPDVPVPPYPTSTSGSSPSNCLPTALQTRN